jgi:hypothetical protein
MNSIWFMILQHQNILTFIKKTENGCFRNNKSVRELSI